MAVREVLVYPEAILKRVADPASVEEAEAILTDLRVYLYGEVAITVYVVGRDARPPRASGATSPGCRGQSPRPGGPWALRAHQ